jgi:hypothetical protein
MRARGRSRTRSRSEEAGGATLSTALGRHIVTMDLQGSQRTRLTESLLITPTQRVPSKATDKFINEALLGYHAKKKSQAREKVPIQIPLSPELLVLSSQV